MINKVNKIMELLNLPSATAPDITQSLKVIGDGNMLQGVKNTFSYAFKEGERGGIVKGGIITLGACGAICLASKGVKIVKKKMNERQTHYEIGEKIQNAFSKELIANPDKVGLVYEETENVEV